MLEIKELSVCVAGVEILKRFSLSVLPGSVHAIMGPNGAGKSTLAKVLAGHPDYEITGGSIQFNGKNVLELDPEERSHLGIFMSFQYPLEIPGISNWQFLHAVCNAKSKAAGGKELSKEEFNTLLDEKLSLLEMKSLFKERGVNEGFSGGEKKRNEILQMALLNPKVAILDETDSGLDIDAMRIVARGVNALKRPDNALILITHYQRLLDYIKPDYVHVMVAGKIVETGDYTLAHKLEAKGYDWTEEEPCK